MRRLAATAPLISTSYRPPGIVPDDLPNAPAAKIPEVPLPKLHTGKNISGVMSDPSDRFTSFVKYMVNLYEISGDQSVDLFNVSSLAHKKNQGDNVFLRVAERCR